MTTGRSTARRSERGRHPPADDADLDLAAGGIEIVKRPIEIRFRDRGLDRGHRQEHPSLPSQTSMVHVGDFDTTYAVLARDSACRAPLIHRLHVSTSATLSMGLLA